MKQPARRIALMALMTALLFAVQVALSPIPNVEGVTLLIVLFTLHFGWQALGIVYAFVLLEGLMYGFGMWFVNYLYVWTVLWALTMLCRRRLRFGGWVLLQTAFGLGFGMLCAIPYLLIGGATMAWSYFLSGIPFDLLHAAGNAVMALTLFRPLDRVMTRMCGKML